MKSKVFNNLWGFSLGMIAFSLAFGLLSSNFIVILCILWIAEGNWKKKWDSLKRNTFFYLSLLFFSLHFIGLLYSTDLDTGLFAVQLKLSLIVFPIILSGMDGSKVKPNQVFLFYLSGLLLSSLGLLIRAIILYLSSGENHFFYQAFSVLLHPSYYAMYLLLGMAWVFFKWMRHDLPSYCSKTIFVLLLLVYFSFILLLLSSKMGLIGLFFLLFFMGIYYIYIHRKYSLGIIGGIALTCLSYAIVEYVPEIHARLNRAIEALQSDKIESNDAESTGVRILVWKASIRVAEKQLMLGCGTGDVQKSLMEEYRKENLSGALEHHLNCHNEYLQTLVRMGLLGFMLLIGLFAISFYQAFSKKQGIFIVFLFLISLNFVPESMLETQAGSIFFGFFNTLFFYQLISDKP